MLNIEAPRNGTERRHDALERFLNSRNYELLSFKTQDGVFWIAVPQNDKDKIKNSLPRSFMGRILKYHKEKLKKDLNFNVLHGQCMRIAQEARKELKYPVYGGGGVLVGRGPASGAPMGFYRDFNYGYHAINYADITVPGGKDAYLAFDLTSHITMFADDKKTEIFAIVANNLDGIIEKFKQLTGDKDWEIIS